MKTMFKFLSLAAILAVAAAPAAHADAFNSQLTQGPGSTTNAKVYYGSGNPNSGFDVVTAGNVQRGLEAVIRHHGPLTSSYNNYFYTPGPAASPDPSTQSNWDFVFSVNTGSDTLSDYNFQIDILNVTTGQHVGGSPTVGPNAQSNGSVVACNNCAYNKNNNGLQNSENLGFSFLQSAGTAPAGFQFDPNAADTYKITLTATGAGLPGGSLTDTINVVPTPEPSSLIFLG